MKTPVSLLSSALLLAMTSSVFAASSVDLSVKGLITPALVRRACQVMSTSEKSRQKT